MNSQGQYPPQGRYPGQAPPAPGQYPPQPAAPYGYQPLYQPHPPRPNNGGQIAAAVAAGFLVTLLIAGEIAHRLVDHPRGHTKAVVKPTQILEPGVAWHEVDLPGGDGTRTLWIYVPTDTGATPLPCVFIAPAGSTCFTGMALAEDDRPEHLPYVRAGDAVVAYSVDGAMADQTERGQIEAIENFRDSHFGVDDEKAAVDYALANIPHIDSSRLYAAGHSSAGTMALLAAESDHRLAGCIAYAPRSDVRAELTDDDVNELSSRVDGFDRMLTDCSPLTHVSSISCPVFLFHSDDDETVPTEDVEGFDTKLRETNRTVTYCHVEQGGGHYQSMIDIGVPQAIAWLQNGMPTAADAPLSPSPTGGSGYVPADSFDGGQSQ